MSRVADELAAVTTDATDLDSICAGIFLLSLTSDVSPLDLLMLVHSAVGDVSVVLLGESTHGTEEVRALEIILTCAFK